MREFFRGWRRKVGCVLFVMASTAVTAWCRSMAVQDRLDHVSGGMDLESGIRLCQITSNSGVLRWETIGHFEDFLDSAVPQSGWITEPATERNRGYSGLRQWGLEWSGFDIAKGKFGRTEIRALAVPYWLIAVPLRLASAYLILWPGKRRATQTTKP